MKYKVFFNPDCLKWGVMDENGRQVLIQKRAGQPRRTCFDYTRFKGIAQKYANRMNSGECWEYSYKNKGV